MKFAKVFEQVLTDEHLPSEWTSRAIQYKKLKKRINKVVDELENIGIINSDSINYDLEIIDGEIHPIMSVEISPLMKGLIVDKLVDLDYNFQICPLKVVAIDDEHDDAHQSIMSDNIDADNTSLSVYTHQSVVSDNIHLDNSNVSVDTQSITSDQSKPERTASYTKYLTDSQSIIDNQSTITAINPFDSAPFYELKISLLEDTRFFQVLYNEIEELNKFQVEKENEITESIEGIANEISNLTVPNMKKTDLYLWREVFQYYIESEIFFSTVEKHAGEMDINTSKERFFQFLNKLQSSNVEFKFHNKESIVALNNFKNLNFKILKVSNFQSFNNLAVRKILKKFDKQTQLHTKELFPRLLIDNTNNSEIKINLLNTSIAYDICYIMSSKLLSIVPQIDDYLCPICCSIAFKPIRLKCGHLFCIRCLVKLRRKNEDKCPLCRENCLLSLTVDDLDVAQMNYLKLYFPKEVREKELENDKEILTETYGEQKGCIIV